MDTFDKLDKVDLQILRTLQENARLTTKELAARVSLSSTPVFERLKRLESGGYIKKYIAVLDAEKLNQGFVVFCSVKLRRLNRDIAAEFTRIIQDIPEVTECYNISGSYDYLLKIHAPNMKYYQPSGRMHLHWLIVVTGKNQMRVCRQKMSVPLRRWRIMRTMCN